MTGDAAYGIGAGDFFNMSDVTYYYVPGMMFPYWAVGDDDAHNVGADTDMGDLTVKEWTDWFGPHARRANREEVDAWREPGLTEASGHMSDVSDLSKEEMSALAEAVDLWEQLYAVLGRVEARPRDGVLHIDTEVEPGYLGWIGFNESGTVTFQPQAAEQASTDYDDDPMVPDSLLRYPER